MERWDAERSRNEKGDEKGEEKEKRKEDGK